MKRIKWQSQANTPFGLGTLHWSLHFRECTHKSTWHLLVKIMGLAYFSRTIFWCWPTATCAPPEVSWAQQQCCQTPPGGSKSTSRTAHCPSALGENEMQSPEHEISFPVIFLYCFASCTSFSLNLPPTPPRTLAHKPTAHPISIVMDHRENIMPSPTRRRIKCGKMQSYYQMLLFDWSGLMEIKKLWTQSLPCAHMCVLLDCAAAFHSASTALRESF